MWIRDYIAIISERERKREKGEREKERERGMDTSEARDAYLHLP